MLTIREETPQDYGAVREVNQLAFRGHSEGRLVDRLRSQGLVIASLVAVANDQVAGHILFSRLPIETGQGTLTAAALAPMAVRPELQRRGIGSALVRKGLDVCRERGYLVVIVVGHAAYYPRFGFSAVLAQRLESPFSGDTFMALELTEGALDDVAGVVKYPDAFRIVD